jgi:hypothetical protein
LLYSLSLLARILISHRRGDAWQRDRGMEVGRTGGGERRE